MIKPRKFLLKCSAGNPHLNKQFDQGLVASLPWYDHAITQPALDRFWDAMAQFLKAQGCRQVPADLQRRVDARLLRQSPRLMLSQCCGPDLFTTEGADLSVIGRPVFADLDCQQGYYHSHIVACKPELHSPVRVAVNSLSSRSGYLALLEWTQAHDTNISSVQVSGSHLNSLQLLTRGQADIAAIDAHVINQYKLTIDLPILGTSQAAPAPPFVCHRDCCPDNSGLDPDSLDKELLFAALKQAIATCGKGIGIVDIIKTQRTDYQHMRSPPAVCDVIEENASATGRR